MTKNTQNNFGFRIKPFTGSHTARNSVDSSRNSTENASYADDMKMDTVHQFKYSSWIARTGTPVIRMQSI